MTIQTVEQTYNAGETKGFQVPARYFRLITTTTPVSVAFYRNNSHVGDALNVESGFAWSRAPGENSALFDRVEITSGAAQTVKFAVSDDEIKYDRAAGSVNVLSSINNGAVTHSAATPAVADAQIVAANPSRRYLMIQNNDPSATIYVAFGVAASATNGVVLKPGQAYIADNFVPSGAVHLAASAAGAASSVQITEG